MSRSNILCIDPGSCLGWAVFDSETKQLVAAGQIEVPKNKDRDDTEDRWNRLHGMEVAIDYLFDTYQPRVLVIEDVCRCLSGIRNGDGIFWLAATQVLTTSLAKEVDQTRRIPPGTLRSYMNIKPQRKGTPGSKSTHRQFVEQVNVMGFFEKPLLQKQHNIAVAVSLGIMHLGIKDSDVRERIAV